MSIGILGKKIGMTQIYDKGTVIPVTVIKAGPCTVVQKKLQKKEGYNALQVGFEEIPIRKLNKPSKGHLAKEGINLGEKIGLRHFSEFRTDDVDNFSIGQVLDVNLFKVGDSIHIQGRSIGKGFMGVIRRYGCGRGNMTHGSKFHRHPGSIGAGTTPGRVFKGRKMPGRQGNKLITIKNVSIVGIEVQDNLILVKGAVPGAEGGLLKLKSI